jgi:butyrate kinase
MYRILVINPGSTSTKIAYFEDDKKLCETNIFHDAPLLASFGRVNNQFGFRKQMISDFLAANGIELSGMDAIVGRGGSSASVSSGVYEINDRLIDDTRNNVSGVEHPANLGVPLAAELAAECGARAFMVDSPKTDEFSDEARVTGIDGIYRVSSLHVLNLKGTARLWCREHGIRYEDAKLIVCHIDGGMSVSAHDRGRMIDGTNNAWGEGPFTPTRTGALPAYLAAEYFRDRDPQELMDACTRSGGFVSHFGTSDSDRVHEMAAAGDRKAALVWNAMIYNICKSIGSMAAVLSGKADAIVCGGGLLRFDDLCSGIEERCGFIAPVYFYPGEVEHEAMAAGALRVLRGEEEPKTYTGVPVHAGFGDL